MTWWKRWLARLGVRTPTGRDAVAAVLLIGLSLARLPLGVAVNGELPLPTGTLAAAYLLASADLATIAFRRRYPRVAYAVASLLPLLGAGLAARPAFVGIGLVVCAYTVATSFPRRTSAGWTVGCLLIHLAGGIGLTVAGGRLAGLLTFWGLQRGDFAGMAIVATTVYGMAWLTGSYVQTRRAYRAELAERFRRLEREREERARTAVIEERARIARELHDIAAHDLSAIVVQAGAADRLVERDPAAAKATLRAIRAQGRDTLSALRGLVSIMREADPWAGPGDGDPRAPQPSLSGVEDLVRRVRDTGTAVDLTVEGDVRPLPAAVDLAAYRVIQEALTNAQRHAPGAPVAVTTTYRRGELNVVVRNDAPTSTRPPDDASAANGGHGLAGMRERVLHANGRLSAGPAGDGWRVEAWFPLASNADRLGPSAP